jgi:hypothetical protein
MSPDIESAFGHYGPNGLFQSLIVSAQNSPTNWLGQQFAQMVRKLVMQCGHLPIDVAVGPIRMRCYLRDNLSEKKFVFMPWRFDRLERQLLIKLLPRDGVFVDIGSNVGIYTLTAATHSRAPRIGSWSRFSRMRTRADYRRPSFWKTPRTSGSSTSWGISANSVINPR